MKLRYKILYILVTVVAMAGCKKDFLDIAPKGQMIPKTTDDYRLILDFISNKNSVGTKVAILVTHGAQNLLADDYQVSDDAQFNAMMTTDRKLWYYWGREGGYNAELDDPDWKATYGQIYIMNSALEGLPDAEGPETEKQALMAEAKFHRAFCFLGLVNLYAKHYNPATAGTDPGVPLRLTTLLTEDLTRKSVQQTYDQIIKDLEEALPHLQANHGIYNHRPTTAGAHAILARTYLFMGNYEKALEHSNASLGISNHLYDLNTELVRVYPANDRVNSFNSAFRSWDDKEILVQKETTYHTSLYHFSYATIWGPTVWALYDTAVDLRFRHYFRPTTSGNGYTFEGSRRRWQDAYYYLQVGPSTPEMYLTRAEASIRTSNKDQAITDLNTLRSKRYKAGLYVPYVASDYTNEQVLDLVKDERRRELWLRGLRWFDLKRYNALDNANISITRYYTNDVLQPGDDGWVMPIGELYINMNPEIKQN